MRCEVYQDFNTKDWIVYDNDTNRNICHADTEEDAKRVADELKSKEENRLFTTYEEPLKSRTFTEQQMHEVYSDLADKTEYPDFATWLSDMLKSGVFEEIR